MALHIPSNGHYRFEHDFPAGDTPEHAYYEQAFQRAVEAYRFFYPTVSAEGIFNGGREIGIEDGKELMLLAAGPQHLVFTANSDTPYASGVLDLRAMGPTVVDLPPGPYIGLIDDHNQRWVVDMGIPGPDGGQGGKYLVLPPGFDADIPRGYHVARSPTYKALLALRALPVGGDTAGAMEALRRVRVYPLSSPSTALPYVDVTERSLDSTPLRWEDNLEYWHRLRAVLDEEPTLEGLRPMYGELAALGLRRGRPFSPDPRMESVLEAAARAGLDQMRVEGFASRRPERLVWEDRRWEWVGLVPEDANFETEGVPDLEARDRWFVQAVVTSPAMFRRKAGVGSVYYLAARDVEDAYLDGGRAYRLAVPQPVPAELFWSVTAYDSHTRSQVQTPQNRAVLGSLADRLEPGPDGAVEIHFGPEAPAGHEKQWIQTTPDRGFFLYFRIYGPQAAALDGTWRLGDLKPIGELWR